MQDNQALLTALTMLLSGQGAGPANTQAQVLDNSPKVSLPYGCTGVGPIAESFIAKSVDDLISWDDFVICENGGTKGGVKVMFISVKPTKRSEKSYSARDGWMARFEVCKAGGRNPMNEVINVFVKQERDYIPYLNPAKWSVKQEIVVFKSEDEAEPDRTFRLNMIFYMGELISDSAERKCQNIAKRLGDMYSCYIDGERVELD